MTKTRTIITLTIPAAALLLSACATGLPTRVSRFQAMPAPQGQSFIIQPARDEDRGGLEFARYADLVRQNLVYQGYRPAAAGEGATLVVVLDYGIGPGQQEIRTYPSSRFGGFYDPFYPRFGWGHRSPFYYGWNDPFYFGGGGFGRGYDISTRTVYTSFLDMDIRRASDGQAVFEGEAQARSSEDELQVLVPSLVEAMFAGFPGRSGETVRITVPPADRRG